MGKGGVQGCALVTMGAGGRMGLELSEEEEGLSGGGGLPRQSGGQGRPGDWVMGAVGRRGPVFRESGWAGVGQN